MINHKSTYYFIINKQYKLTEIVRLIMYIKLLDEKALQKIFKNSTVLVFNNRTKIITDGIL